MQNTVLLENAKEKNESECWAQYWSFAYLRKCVLAIFLVSLVIRVFHCVERFHMTSWRPMIPVYRNNEMTPMLMFETKPVKAFFCSNPFFYRCWSREWQRCILTLYIPPAIKRMYKQTFCYFFHVGAKPPPKCFIKPNFGYFQHYSTKFVVLAQTDMSTST